jgi:hypothetical protein
VCVLCLNGSSAVVYMVSGQCMNPPTQLASLNTCYRTSSSAAAAIRPFTYTHVNTQTCIKVPLIIRLNGGREEGFVSDVRKE